ncbi:hypothetical protein [Euzebya sp.]|uniref:hypothetical protein n=1 Tax=Euzebya sp. TaxID=1971409 RepID=UPI0035114104
MIRRTSTLLTAVALVLGLAACGGADDGDRQAFIDAAAEGSGGELDEETAGCIYDALAEELDADQIDQLAGNFDAEPDDPAIAEAAITALQGCVEGG